MSKLTLYWTPTIEKADPPMLNAGIGRRLYFASHLDWPGVDAQGYAIHEALQIWHKNRRDREKDMIADGLTLPVPSQGGAVWMNTPCMGYWDAESGVLNVWLQEENDPC